MAIAPLTDDEIRDVNQRYHDGAAAAYDAKWGIDYGAVGAAQVLGKLRKMLPAGAPTAFGDALEIGAGTGYFTLHLLRAGLVRRATATDISPGMLRVLEDNAAALGVDVTTVACDAEQLPFDDESFDLVHGHAILHHIPDLDQAFREFHRVLRPGGFVAFAGEPSERGDRIAAVPKRLAVRAAPLWRRAMRARPASAGHDDGGAENHELEQHVDIHAFVPGDLAAPAGRAGLTGVRVRGEELLANWFGWTNRTLEASADPDSVPMAWRQYAFRGYLLLQQVDTRLLEGWLPPGVFYNLMISAQRPGRSAPA